MGLNTRDGELVPVLTAYSLASRLAFEFSVGHSASSLSSVYMYLGSGRRSICSTWIHVLPCAASENCHTEDPAVVNPTVSSVWCKDLAGIASETACNARLAAFNGYCGRSGALAYYGACPCSEDIDADESMNGADYHGFRVRPSPDSPKPHSLPPCQLDSAASESFAFAFFASFSASVFASVLVLVPLEQGVRSRCNCPWGCHEHTLASLPQGDGGGDSNRSTSRSTQHWNGNSDHGCRWGLGGFAACSE
jgi:hypothetical protein